MIVVLVVASGGSWETEALRVLGESSSAVVLKWCVDLPDLLASAASGQAQVAVLDAATTGLDAGAVEHLRRHGVHPVAVAGADDLDGARVGLRRVGVHDVVDEAALDTLPDAVSAVVARAETRGDARAHPLPPPPEQPPDGQPPDGPRGRVIAVWGPTGAPGRSLVASALAAELARRRRPTVLVDADPYGGSLGQMLGITDEVSGLLAAARWVVSGQLEERFASVQRALGPCLTVITGLPRPERWSEVRPGSVEEVLDLARRQGDVVVDTGFSLEEDPAHDLGGRPTRNHLTLSALAASDEVVVVGGADPVGLSRLARSLVDLREVAPVVPLHVVVNRMRPSLGWSERDIAAMLTGFVRSDTVHFLPDDRVGVDRALVAGRTLLEGGESALTRAVGGLAEIWAPTLRQRTAGRARRR